MATPGRVPLRGAHGAPIFAGTPNSLLRYFRDVEDAYANAGLTPTDAQRIRQAIYYLDVSDAELWEPFGESAPGGASITWIEFKKRICALYPGSDKMRLYAIQDLEDLVETYARKGVYTRGDYGEYLRDFTRISAYLNIADIIDERTARRLFIRGFGEATRRKIEQRLAIKLPDHHPSDPYRTDDVRDAAEFLLSNTTPGPSEAAKREPTPMFASPRSISMPAFAVKQELPDVATLSQMILAMQDKIDSLAKAVAGGTPSAATGANAIPMRRPRNPGCHFCGGPEHFINGCPSLTEYIKKGLCIRNETGQVVLPSRQYLPRTAIGVTMAERFDSWHAMNPSQRGPTTIRDVPPHMASTNLFEITPSTTWEATQTAPSAREEEEETQVYEATEAGEDDDEVLVAMNMLHNQLVLNMEKRKEKRVRFAGVEMPERQRKSVPEPSTAPSVTRSEKESLSKSPGASNRADEPSLTTYPTPATKANPVVTVVNPTTTIAKKPADGPQFKYQSPIEDPSIPSSVLNRALDTSILLSHRELLAITPDL